MKRISRVGYRASSVASSGGRFAQGKSASVAAPQPMSETLGRAAETFRRIIETTHEGIWMADLEGITAFVNPQMARMLGTTPEKILGRPVFDYLFKEDHSGVRERFRGFLQARTGQEVEERLRRKDGTELWAIVAASVFRDESGQPLGFLGMFSDVTERKRMEEALRKSEASLQLQINRMPIPHILWNPEFRVRSWNPAAERLFGYTAQEALGKHPYELIVPRGVQPQVDTVWRRLLQGDTTAHSINENLTKDGRKILCEWSNTPIKDGTGGIVGVLSMVLDITERKRAEETMRTAHDQLEIRVQERTAALKASHAALAESEEKHRRLFETISDAAFVFDAETRQMVEVNQAALRLYGYIREEFLKLRHGAITAEPEDSEATIRLTLAGVAPRIPLRYHRRKDGSTFPVEISASTFSFRGRQMVCGVIRDITARKQAENTLRRNVELQGEILAISEREQRRLGQDLHDDLCQQLVGIQFLCERLASDFAGRSSRRAAQAREIGKMVRRALNQTRELAHGLSPVTLEAGGLADALRELAARTRKVFRLDCRFRGGGPLCVTDHASVIHLYRIAQEAVSNAVRHGKARRILIELGTNGRGVTLAVRDNGVGIPRRLPKRKGMGVPIMQYRAEVIGGSLAVQREPGGGTAVICAVQQSGPGARDPENLS